MVFPLPSFCFEFLSSFISCFVPLFASLLSHFSHMQMKPCDSVALKVSSKWDIFISLLIPSETCFPASLIPRPLTSLLSSQSLSLGTHLGHGVFHQHTGQLWDRGGGEDYNGVTVGSLTHSLPPCGTSVVPVWQQTPDPSLPVP